MTQMGLLYFIILLFLFVVVTKYLKSVKKPRDEIGDLFEKFHKLLHNEEDQIAVIPGLNKHVKINSEERYISNLYGISPDDPIRANGPIGEVIYISRLVNNHGKGFIGHRLGSISGLDVFEAVSTDFQNWIILWFDMYWNTKDIIAPAGLKLVSSDQPWPDSILGLSASNRFCSTFPHGFWSDILSATNEQLGWAIVKPLLQTLNSDGQQRPQSHAKLIKMVLVAKRAQGIGEDS